MLVCRPSHGELRIEVRDSGVGIAEHDLEEIFQEFHQLHDNVTEGLGLGLAITRRIADLLNHQVGVRSSLGKGSLFYVTVPVVGADSDEDDRDIPDLLGSPFLQGVSVLCIDDEPAILEATRAILERWGAQVTTIKRVKEYEELCRIGASFDVFIADYQLRDEKMGLELLRHFKDSFNPEVLGVLMTAERDPGIEDQALMEGFEFIEKPVEPGRLKEVLDREAADLREFDSDSSLTGIQ